MRNSGQSGSRLEPLDPRARGRASGRRGTRRRRPRASSRARTMREEARELREDERLVPFLARPRRAAAGARRAWRSARRARARSSSPGWQAAWRSRSSASRTWIFDRSSPSPSDAAEQRPRGSGRAARRRACAAPAPARSSMRLLGLARGRSGATCSLVRRRMNGRSAAAERCRASRSSAVRAAEPLRRRPRPSPSIPGFRNSNRLHSSPRWFSIGVPVSASRCSRPQEPRGLGRLGRRVLDRLRLVEDHVVERARPSKRAASRRSVP